MSAPVAPHEPDLPDDLERAVVPEGPIHDAHDGTAHTTTYKRQERHRMHYATLFCVKNIDAVKQVGLWIYESRSFLVGIEVIGIRGEFGRDKAIGK